MVKLAIKQKELEKIKDGSKNVDFRKPSFFNKKILLKKNENGLFEKNTEIKEIEFYSKSEKIIKKIKEIIPLKFTQNYNEVLGEKIEARINECIIAIIFK